MNQFISQDQNHLKAIPTSEERPKILMQSGIFQIFIFICGFLAVQRFEISTLSIYVCLFPLICFYRQLYIANRNNALTCLILAIFMQVDNGANAYIETPAPMRYLIYLSVCAFIFNVRKIKLKSLPAAFLIIGSVMIGSLISLSSNNPIDLNTLYRDLEVLIILSIFLFADNNSTKLNFHLLFVGMLGCLFGEVLNGILFYRDYQDYLSYNSTKAFIIFPAAYAILVNKNLFIKIILIILTMYVVFLFGTRMIVFSTAVLVLLSFIFWAKNNLRKFKIILVRLSLISVVFFGGIISFQLLNETEFIRFKAFSFILIGIENFDHNDIWLVVKVLDPIRYYEHKMFFQRSFPEIIFGSGLGSGLRDTDSLLNFVNTTAFSENEINSSIFFNFHDFWIDFGLRFGVLSLIWLFFVVVIKPLFLKNPIKSILFGVMLINTTFSISGILLTAILIRHWPTSYDYS